MCPKMRSDLADDRSAWVTPGGSATPVVALPVGRFPIAASTAFQPRQQAIDPVCVSEAEQELTMRLGKPKKPVTYA